MGGTMWGKKRDSQANQARIAEAPAAAAFDTSYFETDTALPAEGQSATAPDQENAQAPATVDSAAAQATAPAIDEKMQAFWRGKLAAANFANAVALFARSPAHRHYTLADLEWCLLPALALNQFVVAETRLPDGQAVPMALVLWAKVSPEINSRLSAAPRYPIRLHPNEWRSGDETWIVDAVGDPKAVQQCMDVLAKTAFGGKLFKMPQEVQGAGQGIA